MNLKGFNAHWEEHILQQFEAISKPPEAHLKVSSFHSGPQHKKI